MQDTDSHSTTEHINSFMPYVNIKLKPLNSSTLFCGLLSPNWHSLCKHLKFTLKLCSPCPHIIPTKFDQNQTELDKETM